MVVKMFNDIFRQPVGQVSSDWADTEIKRCADDLAEKRKAAIESMGTKWILHPAHTVQKRELAANSLGKTTHYES